MERSVLGSAVKTYGGKNRYSRSSYSYRPSALIGSSQNIFDDDDVSPFDRLLHEDKTKNTFVKATPLKSTFNGTTNAAKTNKFPHEDQRSNTLKSVQNTRHDFSTKSSTVHKFCESSKSYANKENTIRGGNQLFLSDSDSSGNDVFDYKTVGKKGATTTKKKKKKDFGLKNASRAINQSDKRKRRLEYREKCRNKSKNSSSSKCSFVKLDADGYGIPTRRGTLVDRRSMLSFAKPLDDNTTGTENYVDSFKSMFAGIKKYAEKLANSDQSSIPTDSASNYVSVDTTSNSLFGSSLSPPHRNSLLSDFCPVQISTPRQSTKLDFKILARSPIYGNVPGDCEEFDPKNLSKSLRFIKNRLSDLCKKTSSLCEVFEKSCSLLPKQSESVHEQMEQSGSLFSKIGGLDVEAEVNVSGETNCSRISMDIEDCSRHVSSQSDEVFSANNSFEKTEKNDETESHYMSLDSSSADHSRSNVTVEMKMLEPPDSDGENVSRQISRDLFKASSPEANTSSDFSDSADEKYETIVQRAETTKSTASERNSAYVDTLLLSVLHPSSKSSLGESFRSSSTSYLPLAEPSFARTLVFSPSSCRSSIETASTRSSVAPSHIRSSRGTCSPLSSTKLSLENASDRSYAASRLSFTESFVDISPFSTFKTLPNSDLSGSDELMLTVREKTRPSTTTLARSLSQDFAGFETSPAGVSKLAAFKGEVEKLQKAAPSLSPVSRSNSLPSDSGIEDIKSAARSILRSDEDTSYSRRRSGILRRDAGARSRKSVRFEGISIFEPLLEEKGEDSLDNEEADSCHSIRPPENVPHLQSRGHFTERRRKRCPLPTLSEADAETDEGFGSQNTVVDRVSSAHDENQTLLRSPIFLAKGKKWRRSFLVLKNVRDFGFNPDSSAEENKGRCWRQNVEQLIQSQLETTFLPRELDECTVSRTGFDGKTTSGFEEGDTLTEKSIYSRRSRFSLSIRVDRSHRPIGQNSILDESSLARLALESRDSFVADVNVSAGDHFLNYSLPRIDFGAPHTAREIVLRYCHQSQPLPFDECFDDSVLKSCKKIGEGVYGEVFSLRSRSKSSVIKIIPIEGDQKVNGERQKRFDEILSELVISLELSNLRKREDYYTNCFAQVQRCWCVQGRYPSRLIGLWEEYDQKKGSDNDSPKIFKDDQLYVILELNNGGEDLESFEFNNAQQTLSVFKQVANALAVAEQAFKFEHRDLHWGNVLISPTKQRESSFIFGDKTRNVQLFGVKVTIIDYTLSRISVNNHTLYNNIGQDPDLFTAEGDFQFEVYRLMRKEVDDIWSRYVPKTNVIWLYYLIDKMINEVRYRRDYTKIHQTNVEKLKRLHASVLNFESSCELVENQPI